MLKTLLSPSMALMNRLDYPRRFAFLGLVVLIAIGVAVSSLSISLDRVIRTAQHEQQGLDLIKPLNQTIQMLQRHRGSSAAVLGGIESMRAERASIEGVLAGTVVDVERRLPPGMRSDPAWKGITESIDRLRKEGLGWTVQENFSAHTDLVERLLNFSVSVADEFELTLDPEVGSFYLIDTAAARLPQALEHLGQIRAYGTGILAKKQVSVAQKVIMGTLMGQFRLTLRQLNVGLDKTGRHNPKIHGELLQAASDIEQSSQQIITRVESDIFAEKFVTSPEDFFLMSTQAIDASYRQMYDTLLPAASLLLQERIAHAEQRLRLIVGISVLLFLLTAYFSIGIYYVTISSVQALARAAGRFAAGEMDARVVLETQDEIRHVGDSFNEMADAFSALLAAQRDSEDKLRSAYEQAEVLSQMRSGQNELNGLLRGEHSMTNLSDAVLGYLANHLNAGVGAIYLYDEEADELRLTATFACAPGRKPGDRIRPGERLIGEAVRKRQRLSLSPVPAGYLSISSALGEAAPGVVTAVPLIHGARLVGALEVGTLQPIDAAGLAFIDLVAESIAIEFSVTLSRLRTSELLEETMQQTEELRVQQEELQQSNAELEERAQMLEQQREQIRLRNQEIEAAAEVLRLKAEELERVSAYKSEFLANMSHELRTPLNSMLILSGLLEKNKEGNLSEKQVEFSATIHSAGKDLLNLINDILDISKIEAGQLQIESEDFQLRDFTDALISLFNPLAEQKALRFHVHCDPCLPAEITGDQQRIQQIMKNLLSNAFKFTKKGEVALEIYLAGAGENPLPSRAVAFRVSDSGIGIPADKQELIFQAFKQVDGSVSRKYGGTGLGLSISLQLALKMEGQLHVSSEVGRGSVFTLYLPLHPDAIVSEVATPGPAPVQLAPPPALAAMAARPPSRKGDDGPIPYASLVPDDRDKLKEGGRSILIVEDDANFAKILVSVVREQDFFAISAGDGEAGIALAERYLPNAILLDVMLPRIDGWGVMRAIKENPLTRHIPVHFITCLEDRQKALNMGAVGFVTKPVSPDQLDEVFKTISGTLAKSGKRLLIVEDNPDEAKAMFALLGEDGVDISLAATGREALELLSSQAFDCMVLDLKLADMSGFELLEYMQKLEKARRIPVIIHSGKDLTHEDEFKLRHYAESIIIKGAKSPERLLNEVTLFLHMVESKLHPSKQRMIRTAIDKDAALEGRKVLLVDDDMRNIFSLSSVLLEKNLIVIEAENGREALAKLAEHPDISIVLMDVMMPEMDGYTATREIRKNARWAALPVITMTAKALKGDYEKCMAAGASDYISKPIDVEKLFSLIRVWLYQRG